MDYFNILKLNREPFSNSPDPDFFFHSRQHHECLQKLELALRLRRGLNVIVRDVGTGKTTLCRQLIRRFSEDTDLETHLILDPDIASPEEFLSEIAEMLSGTRPDPSATQWQLKESIKTALFRKGVDEDRTVVLIIDEGQKIPPACLELLREFLNYETNEYKLLQIAIFAQTEFQKTLDIHANFADRINLMHRLGPMNFRDTRQMIRFRINQSRDTHGNPDLFTFPALYGIYLATGGYPRQIVHLCHQCLLAVIIQNRTRAGWALVRSCNRRERRSGSLGWWLPVGSAILILAVIGALNISGTLMQRTPEKPMPVTSDAIRPLDAGVTSAVNQQPAPGDSGPDDPNRAVASGPAPTGEGGPDLDTAGAGSPIPQPVAATHRPEVSEAAPEPPPDTLLAAGDIEPPDILGRVTLGTRETLWRLVEKVYGSHDPRYLRSVQQANPHIHNLDRVEVGDQIIVPAIPARIRTTPEPRIWLRLADARTLDNAVDMLRKHPPEAPPIRVVPHWDHQKGLSFSVLLKRVHFDEDSARSQRAQVARILGTTPELVSTWAPDTIFYANPYRSPRM